MNWAVFTGEIGADRDKNRSVRFGDSDGASSSGKTQDFGSCIRRFESSRPSHEAQLDRIPCGRCEESSVYEKPGSKKAGP